MTFKEQLLAYQSIINNSLETTLPRKFNCFETPTPRTQSLQDYVLWWGKRIRPILALMYAEECGMKIAENTSVFAALEVFHDFILAHDDIIDQDAMRRWSPTIHTRLQTAYPHLQIQDKQHFWESLAIIGGDVLHAIAQQYVLYNKHVEDSKKVLLMKIMNEAMLAVTRWWYKQFLSDSMAIADVSLEYIINYNLKEVTGSYTFLFPLRFGQALATGNSATDPVLETLLTAVWILFQTGDDIIGLFGDPKKSGKSNHGDIIQGKKTIPVYFAYQYASPEEKSILAALIGKHDLSEKEACIARWLIEKYGLWPSKAFMQDYAQQAYTSLEQLPRSEDYKARRYSFISYLMTREW